MRFCNSFRYSVTVYYERIPFYEGGVAIRPLFGPLSLEKIQVLNIKIPYSFFERSMCLPFEFIDNIKWFWILLPRGIDKDRYPNWFWSIFAYLCWFLVIFHHFFQLWTIKTLEYPNNFTNVLKIYKRPFHGQKIVWVLKCYSSWILKSVNLSLMTFP